ncbi:RND transporter [Vibrio sp. 10N.286.49.B3]|uniref:TolC family protein n=1 Tax=Vibrio sp. 10N.286.49.B3 TaxID=1880855 RepID=UPI000C81C28E|nr:TolC family protein [Vibrio sp. 10N.286.49.B3]PMH43251.1 RND transporter [Vibrio sp. 10N.286.49.B3]
MTFRYSILSLVLTGLMGCASQSELNMIESAENSGVQTNQQLIEQLIAQHQLNDKTTRQATSLIPPVRLTDLVSISELNQYLDLALANSPTIQQSLLALKVAYAQQGVTRSDGLPTVEAGLSAETNKDNSESYSADLTVSWELDLWQKIADSSAAAEKDIAISYANYQGTKDLIAANTMRAWLSISLHQQLLDIEQRRLVILQNNEALVLERYQAGLGSLEDLDNAKSTTATTQATVAAYQENVAQSQRSLTLLTGQWQQDAQLPSVSMTFPEVLNPLDGLAEQNLQGRPDLQQAFYSIEAESLRTDAAYKAMLPSISLSASLQDIAETPSEALFTNPLWSVLGSLSAPLFQGGKLKSQAEIAELTMAQSYWLYQETLLNAVNEVENAAGQEYALDKQQQHLITAIKSAKRSFVSYEQKYRQGLVDIFDLLTVQQQVYDLEAQLTNTTYQRLINRIDLGLALGLGVS